MRQVLIYCTDYTCGHYNIVTDDADPSPDEAAIGGLLGNRVCAYCVRRTKQKTPQHEVCLTGPAAQKARHLRRAQVREETMSQASAGFVAGVPPPDPKISEALALKLRFPWIGAERVNRQHSPDRERSSDRTMASADR